MKQMKFVISIIDDDDHSYREIYSQALNLDWVEKTYPGIVRDVIACINELESSPRNFQIVKVDTND